MYSALIVILFLSFYLILHTYVIYPFFLILTTSKRKNQTEEFSWNDNLPTVGILMAAYNEEKVIGDKIASVFATSYPLEKLVFYIGSDASTDGTDAIISDCQKKYPQIKLKRFPGRTGKSGIINQLAAAAKEEIYLLTDANVIFKKDTIFNLIRHFRNEKVAQVCANIIKISKSDRGIASQEKSYIALENKIKYYESLRWNIVMGAEGGCYAIRSKNFSPVPPKFYMDDFYITLNVIEQKKEIVFDTEAVCLEDVPTHSHEEYKRKVRISIGNYQNLFRYRKLLFPPWKGSAFAFWSHKLLRWITPFLLMVSLAVNTVLIPYSDIFLVLFILQLTGTISPLIDRLIRINFKPLRFVSHFYMMNMALLNGFFIYIKGVDSNVWQPTKRELN